MTVKQEAKSLVKSMLWQFPKRTKMNFIVAKGCAIVMARRLLRDYNESHPKADRGLRYYELKALPKAINELEYKP